MRRPKYLGENGLPAAVAVVAEFGGVVTSAYRWSKKNRQYEVSIRFPDFTCSIEFGWLSQLRDRIGHAFALRAAKLVQRELGIDKPPEDPMDPVRPFTSEWNDGVWIDT